MVAVVVTGRGGAGKTTMSANLSTYFSLNGYKTLVIDGDLYLPKLAFHFGIYNPVTNLHTLLSTPDARLKDAIYHDVKTGVDVLPGSSKLFDILTMDEKRLRDIVRDAAENYDVTFIDSPLEFPLIPSLPSGSPSTSSSSWSLADVQFTPSGRWWRTRWTSLKPLEKPTVSKLESY